VISQDDLTDRTRALARGLAARGRGLWARVRSPRLHLLYDNAYRSPDVEPVDPERGRKILAYLYETGSIHRKQLTRPPRASITDLLRVHDPSYLETLEDAATLERILGTRPLPGRAAAIVETQRWMVGGTMEATRRAVEVGHGGPVQVNLGGGLHHGLADRGSGFCLFNDVAIAIARVRADGFAGRILVIDLDLHQGDGTRAIFAQDEEVFTFSVHATTLDDTPAVANLDVELGAAASDRVYLTAIRAHLPRVVDLAKPDLVFYVAGVDVAIDDRLGSWRVSAEAIAARDREVVEAVASRPLVWVLAGGYGPDAWRHSARSLATMAAGVSAPIPSGGEKRLGHFRTIKRTLPTELLSTDPEADISITLDDMMVDLGTTPAPNRFLGFYTRYGIEVALERYGVLSRLRTLGFDRVEVSFALDHASGQMVRVTTASRPKTVLIELLVNERRDEDYRMLFIEWLLLQNPRAQATGERPLLPEQRHPGLGLLGAIIGMLVMACERLELDGLMFHPAHYHVAAVARSVAIFRDPVIEARFRSAQAALERLPLARASAAVDSGLVVDAETQAPYAWVGEAMVIPASARLRAALESPEYEEALERNARPFVLLAEAPPRSG
jgi:acetoin utilization deacetylase AcuC-like enzyme